MKERKKTLRKVWIAYVWPDDWAEFTEAEFRVIAPASWDEKRVLKALREKGIRAAYLCDLLRDLEIRAEKIRGIDPWIAEGEEFIKAWKDLPKKVLYLPSGKVEDLPEEELEGRVRLFDPTYPQAEISVQHHEEEGQHVVRVYVSGIQRYIFRWNFRTFSHTVRDFMPVSCLCDFIDNGYEVVFGPVKNAEAVQVICKLIENIAKRLITGGFLCYLLRNGKALPKYYLQFINHDELQILQSLMRD